jgi:hypothetical protein
MYINILSVMQRAQLFFTSALTDDLRVTEVYIFNRSHLVVSQLLTF